MILREREREKKRERNVIFYKQKTTSSTFILSRHLHSIYRRSMTIGSIEIIQFQHVIMMYTREEAGERREGKRRREIASINYK